MKIQTHTGSPSVLSFNISLVEPWATLDTGMAKLRPYSSTNGWTGVTGHCCWWTNKWNGGKISGEDFFFFCSFFFFFKPKRKWKKVPMCVMACVCVKCCVFSVYARAVGASSFSAASGSAGLVEAHRFAQPAGKVHFLHFWPLDERMILRESRREATVWMQSWPAALCDSNQITT